MRGIRNAHFILALLFLWLPIRSAKAGTISLAWDPVASPDLIGYRIYYGTSTLDYGFYEDIGNVAQTTVTDLNECTDYFVAVKAVNSSGMESADYSNEISGWPRPEVAAISPPSVIQGENVDVMVEGVNYRDGASLEVENHPEIMVITNGVQDCMRLAATVMLPSTLASGAYNISVTNPDRTFGTGTALLRVGLPDSSSTSNASTPVTSGCGGCRLSSISPLLFLLMVGVLLAMRNRSRRNEVAL